MDEKDRKILVLEARLILCQIMIDLLTHRFYPEDFGDDLTKIVSLLK